MHFLIKLVSMEQTIGFMTTFSSALCMSVLFVEMKCQRDFLFSSVSSSLSFLSLLFSFPLPFSLPPSFSLCPYLYLCLIFLHTRAFAVPFSVYGYIFHSFFLSILFLSHSLPPSISFSFSSSSFSLLPFPFLFHLFLFSFTSSSFDPVVKVK